jgi:hypothetical protein
MIAADDAIARTRRDLTVGALIRYAVFAGAVAVVLKFVSPLVFFAMVAAWLVIGYRAAIGSRLTAGSPALIASGQFDEAEQLIERAMRSFTPSRSAKLTNLYHLAILRHAQHRWNESARLSQALLRLKPRGATGGLATATRRTLAGALLELGDVAAAGGVLNELAARPMNLSEATNFLALQLDHQSRVGLWDEMSRSMPSKMEMAELLPSPKSAKTQPLLALAARRTGRRDWESYLRRRAELLADVAEITSGRPLLTELWSER